MFLLHPLILPARSLTFSLSALITSSCHRRSSQFPDVTPYFGTYVHPNPSPQATLIFAKNSGYSSRLYEQIVKAIKLTVRLPDFLIIGAARCGTSWLAKNIATHPDVFMPPYKEVHFFDRHYSKGIDWYQSCFENRPERLVGEATPAYLYFETIPALVRQHMPDVKIIAILRNPVDRAYSHHANLVAKARAKREDYIHSFESRLNTQKRIIDEGFYSKKLKQYYKLFPADNIKLILNDDAVSDPGTLLRDVFRFLGIDEAFESPLKHTQMNSVRTKLEEPTLIHWLSKVFRRARMDSLSRRLEAKKNFPLPPMADETRSMLLHEHYLAEIERLEKLLNRDLDEWKR